MHNKKFWFVTLCALLLLSAYVGMSVPLRIAIGANALVIVIDVGKKIWGFCNGGNEEENKNFNRG